MIRNFRTSGMTLMEILIACSILSAVIMGALSFMVTSQSVMKTTSFKATLKNSSQAIVERMATELRKASKAQLQVTTNTIQFKTIRDFNTDGTVALSNELVTYQLLTSPNRLVRMEGSQTALLATGVTGSFSKLLSGGVNLVTINLTFSKAIDQINHQAVVNTDVFVPNQE